MAHLATSTMPGYDFMALGVLNPIKLEKTIRLLYRVASELTFGVREILEN